LKKIISYIKDFWKSDFSWKIYFPALLGLAIAIYFNFRFDFEDSVVDGYRKQPISLLYYFLYYASAYFFVIFIYQFFEETKKLTQAKGFWLFSILAISLLSIKVTAWIPIDWRPENLNRAETYSFLKTSKSVIGIVIYTLGILALYFFLTPRKNNFFGLTTKGFNWRPYLFMLLLMLPLILIAATQPDFQKVYPRLKMAYFQEDYWKHFAIYEPFYLMSFMVLEWFFRGVLIIGIARFLGHRAVLPAAVLYCVIHFGKPLGECISSLFGGYLLGIFAYYSRSIWGGIIVHMGIALLMDMAALGVPLLMR